MHRAVLLTGAAGQYSAGQGRGAKRSQGRRGVRKEGRG